MTWVPVTSEGIRSGVNWMRLNDSFSTDARVETIMVLASPGTPTSRQCPRARTLCSNSSMTSSWPMMTLWISPSSELLALARFSMIRSSAACRPEGSWLMAFSTERTPLLNAKTGHR